jgi:hypothetical protein
LPVGVTSRIEDGVVVGAVAMELDDDDACRTLLFELSICASAEKESAL